MWISLFAVYAACGQVSDEANVHTSATLVEFSSFVGTSAIATQSSPFRVVPQMVSVVEESSFQLRLRVLDGNPLPESEFQLSDDGSKYIQQPLSTAVQWSAVVKSTGASTSLLAFAPAGFYTQVTVGTIETGTDGPAHIRVTAEFGKQVAHADVQIVRATDPPKQDQVAAQYTPKVRPGFAFVEGGTSDCTKDRRLEKTAFVGVGLVDNSQTTCPDEIAIAFSVDLAAGARQPSWTDSFERLDLGENTTWLGEPLEVQVELWIADDDTDNAKAEHARIEILLANALFQASGVGLSFVMDGDSARHLAPTKVVDVPVDCDKDKAESLLQPLGVKDPVPDLNAPALLHVVYVGDIYGSAKGKGCIPFSTSRSGLIFIVANSVTSPIIVAHELGHALALRDHAEYVDGLDGSNLMKGFVGSGVAGTQLTMGQMFRMVLDEESWPNHALLTAWESAGLTVQCQSYPDPGECPDLADDL